MRTGLLDIFRRGRALAGDRRGGAATVFAVSLLPIMIAVGAAVDYGSERQKQAELAASLDSATLSVAIARTNGQTLSTRNGSGDAALSSELLRALKAALGSAARNPGVTTTATATIDSTTGAITGSATMKVPTKFLGLIGKPQATISATSVVSVPAGPIEVAMVLDTTGSMAGAKIAALQTAATTLTTTLFSIPNASTNVKVSVVPFTYYVNIGLSSRGASWLTNSTDYSTTTWQCWDTYPNATYTNPVPVAATCSNDGTPYDCSWTSYTVNYGAPVQQCGNITNNYTWNGCVGSRAYPLDVSGQADKADAANQVPALINYGCSTPLQRLTGNQALVQTAINNLTAGGETYIAPGLLWGWRTLSPYKPFGDGAPYNGRTQKFMVLMTDGFNTHSPNYPDHEGSNVGDASCSDVTAANCLTKKTCDSIKAQNIKIYTVAFQVTDPGIKSILQNCATTPTAYYDSASSADLQNAFVSIGNSITAIKLVR